MQEVVVSAALLGAMLGAATGATCANRLGRRQFLLLMAVVNVAGVLGTVVAPTVGWLVASRALTGAAFGIVAFTAPLYISELSPANVRGKLVSLYSLAIVIGVLISGLVDYALSGTGQWRWMFGLGAFPAILFGVGVGFLPESPRWLVARNLLPQARASLTRLRGTTGVDAELEAIQKSLLDQSAGCANLSSPAIRPRLVMGICLAIIRQVTGVIILALYAPTVFAMAGIKSPSLDILASVVVAVILILMTLVAMQLLDRMGRRPLLLIGLAGAFFSLIFLGLDFKLPQLRQFLGPVALVSLIFLTVFWTLGPGTVVITLISEIFPLKIRGQAMAVATVALWGAYFAASITFLSLVDFLGHAGAFWFTSLLVLVSFVYTYFFVPETKGLSLEEIEAEICGRPGAS